MPGGDVHVGGIGLFGPRRGARAVGIFGILVLKLLFDGGIGSFFALFVGDFDFLGRF